MPSHGSSLVWVDVPEPEIPKPVWTLSWCMTIILPQAVLKLWQVMLISMMNHNYWNTTKLIIFSALWGEKRCERRKLFMFWLRLKQDENSIFCNLENKFCLFLYSICKSFRSKSLTEMKWVHCLWLGGVDWALLTGNDMPITFQGDLEEGGDTEALPF